MGIRLYLVRHGQTEWNAVNKFQGHSDIPLSSEGKIQASQLAKHVTNYNIQVVYASDLIRAVETAEILTSDFKLPINKSNSLREINFGKWEGLTLKELKEKYQETVKQWWQEPLNTVIPDGEKLSQVAHRVMGFINNIINNHPNQNVLLVSHGGVIRSIICSALGIDLNQYWRLHLDNCSLSILHFQDNDPCKGSLELYNYTVNH